MSSISGQVITNAASTKILNLQGNVGDDGTPVIGVTKSAFYGLNEQWKAVQVAGSKDLFTFQDIFRGTYIGVTAPAAAGGGVVCNKTSTVWQVIPVDNGASVQNYTVQVPNVNMFWTFTGTQATQLTLAAASGDGTQQFQFQTV